jgi:peptidoglycan/LPS O-acetylase OafA/YrhL
LRGIAIALVLLVHFGARILPESASGEWVLAFCRSGWCGVDLFFVLSGFLITGILLDTRDSPGYYRKFFARRMLRIFPLYYGVLLVVFVVLPLVAPGVVDARVREHQAWLWLYVSNYLGVFEGAEPLRGTTLNFAHFWSLAIEEQFYLCWPFIVSLAGRRHLHRVCWTMVAVAVPLRWGACEWIGPFAPYYLTPCRVDTLACGALAAIAVRSWSVERLVWLSHRLIAVAVAPLTGLFIARRGLLHYDPIVAKLGYSLLAMLFAGLVILVYCRRDSRLAAGLRHGSLQELGRLSYGIYIFHGLFQVFLWQFADRIAAAAGNYATALVVYVTLCGGVAYACARISWPCEAAFLRLKRYVEYGGGSSDTARHRGGSKGGVERAAAAPTPERCSTQPVGEATLTRC